MSQLISLIVPVYNCEDSLPRTLESIRAQSYRNLDVILVDDGSQDRSGAICDAVCEQDSRFRVVHQTNKGPGEARNTGLGIAKGAFIGFVDGGDYIHLRMVESLYEALEHNDADLALVDVVFARTLEDDTTAPLALCGYDMVSSDQLVFNMISNQGGPVIPWAVVWNKLYKRDLLKDLRFHSLFCNEDADFNLRVYLRIKGAVFVQEKLYFYYQNQDSLVRNPDTRLQRLYVNTISNFNMMNHLYGDKKELYKGWMLDYLYRRLVFRRDQLRGTALYSSFMVLSKDIIKKSGFGFITNRYIRFIKKIRFIVYWLFPGIYTWRCGNTQ